MKCVLKQIAQTFVDLGFYEISRVTNMDTVLWRLS
jgi:hypothetical protein